MDVTAMITIPPIVALGPLAATSQSVSTTQVGLLVGGIVVLLLVTARHRRSKSSANQAVMRSDRQRTKAPGSTTLNEVEAVMGQLDQLSRQIHAKIDLKLATLQKLIRDADQRIELLSRQERSSNQSPTLDVELESESPQRAAVFEADPHDAVYRLADSGYTSLQIARELARHTGEIELILSLRRARRAPAFPSPTIRKQAG